MKLVASDLDGTLLLPDRTLSARTVQVLREVVAAGVVLVLVTARPPRTVRPLAEQLQAQGLAICCNGALIYDLGAQRIVRHAACEPEIVHELVTALRQARPGVQFAVEVGELYGCEPGYKAWNPVVWQAALPPRTFESFGVRMLSAAGILLVATLLRDPSKIAIVQGMRFLPGADAAREQRAAVLAEIERAEKEPPVTIYRFLAVLLLAALAFALLALT